MSAPLDRSRATPAEPGTPPVRRTGDEGAPAATAAVGGGDGSIHGPSPSLVAPDLPTPPTPPYEPPASAPLFSFGLVSDVQHADIDDGFSVLGTARYYRAALGGLRRAIDDFAREQVDLVLHLGDVVDMHNRVIEGADADAALDSVMAEFERLPKGTPVLHALGNHCLFNHPREKLNGRMGIDLLVERTKALWAGLNAGGGEQPPSGGDEADRLAGQTALPAAAVAPAPIRAVASRCSEEGWDPEETPSSQLDPLDPSEYGTTEHPGWGRGGKAGVTLHAVRSPGPASAPRPAGAGDAAGRGRGSPRATVPPPAPRRPSYPESVHVARCSPSQSADSHYGFDVVVPGRGRDEGGSGGGDSRAHPWRVLVLDAYDVSVLGRPPGDPRREAAHSILRSRNPNLDPNDPTGLEGSMRRFVGFNGGVGPAQLAWLDLELQRASESGTRVILASHLAFHPESIMPICLLWNYGEVLALVARYPGVVVATLSGHAHREGYFLEPSTGIHHRVLAAVLETPPGTNAHAIVDVYEDRMVVRGRGAVGSGVWMLDRAAAGKGGAQTSGGARR